MRLAAVLVLLVAVGCSTTSTAAVAHSPSAPPTASAPADSPSTSSSPTATPTPYVVTLPDSASPPAAAPGGCVMPIAWVADSTGSLKAGFLQYPSGTIAPAVQTLEKTGVATYDRAVGRWLPVGPQAVSPDGREFAYAEYDMPAAPTAGMYAGAEPHSAGVLTTTGRVHLMDATTGKDRILYSGSPTYSVVGFTAAGVYLAQIGITMDGGFSSGLFLLPVAGGTPVAVPGAGRQMDRNAWNIVNGNAWGSEFIPGTGGLSSGDELVELDLRTGALTTWLTRPDGTAVYLLGVDASGHPLVLTFASGYASNGSPIPHPPTQVVAMTSPQRGTVIYQPPDANKYLPLAPAFANARGMWMGGQGSVWVDTADKLTKTPLDTITIVEAGGACE
ncbi:MAG TPA: hypothetical protein VFB69_01335 [Candidatus Dormibacteraeota bacterium]|nr:hypothetical protein [Candidatus Dormibacteraeota bacterium]